MSEAITLRQWTDVVRRARLGRTVKAVAMVLATYADANGSRVFPGVARLSYECEIGYNTAKACLKILRDKGLIKKVGRRGDADVYQLILADDLYLRCEVPAPAQVEVELDRLRKLKRGTYVPNLRPTSRAADSTGEEFCGHIDGPQNSESAAHLTTPQDESAAHLTNNLRPVNRAAKYQEDVTTTTTHSGEDLFAEVLVPGADDRDEDPISPPADVASTPDSVTLPPSTTDTKPVATPGAVTFIAPPEQATEPTPDAEQNPHHCEHGNNRRRCVPCRAAKKGVSTPPAEAAVTMPEPGQTHCEHGLKIALRGDGQRTCFGCRRNLPGKEIKA